MLFGTENHFYHSSIRRYIALFGSLFTDMVIKRKGEGGIEHTVKVPIRYGKQNVYMSVPQDSSRDHSTISRILPAMAFELTNLYKDVNRKTNPQNKIVASSFNGQGKKNWQFNRVPYNFLFTLYIKTKNIEDALQIVEQIVPAFDGNLSVTIEDIPNTEVETEQDIKIKIEEITMDDNCYDEMKNREIDYTITFELLGFLYKGTKSAYVCKEIDIISRFDFPDSQPSLLDHVEARPDATEENVSALHDIVDVGLAGLAPHTPKKVRAKRKRPA